MAISNLLECSECTIFGTVPSFGSRLGSNISHFNQPMAELKEDIQICKTPTIRYDDSSATRSRSEAIGPFLVVSANILDSIRPTLGLDVIVRQLRKDQRIPSRRSTRGNVNRCRKLRGYSAATAASGSHMEGVDEIRGSAEDVLELFQ